MPLLNFHLGAQALSTRKHRYFAERYRFKFLFEIRNSRTDTTFFRIYIHSFFFGLSLKMYKRCLCAHNRHWMIGSHCLYLAHKILNTYFYWFILNGNYKEYFSLVLFSWLALPEGLGWWQWFLCWEEWLWIQQVWNADHWTWVEERQAWRTLPFELSADQHWVQNYQSQSGDKE